MIPEDYITEWGLKASWKNRAYLEQDLIISRLLVELFSHPEISRKLAFRGGTALYKLYILPSARYSEDIDLVQTVAEPIGEVLGIIKNIVSPLLGRAKWKLSEGRVTLIYRFVLEEEPSVSSKIKIEINTREHFSVFGFQKKDFAVNSRWFSGEAKIQTYEFSELMATKLRALYQRNKGRDLFDIWLSMQHRDFNVKKAIDAFQQYLKFQKLTVTRAMFEENLAHKMESSLFMSDISPILASHVSWDMVDAAKQLKEELLSLLPGEPWREDN